MDEKAIASGLEHFRGLWEDKRGKSVGHSPQIWDARADDWITEVEAEPERKMERVVDTADFLRSRGLLGTGSAVVVVGCGPGLFVKEFAKTAGSALGLDFSQRFIGYAAEKAAEAGIKNAKFEYCDFAEEDISRFEGRFDLAFSSITPATGSWDGIEKLMSLSRAYCCNVSFGKIQDAVAEQISREVFGEKFCPRWDGSSFYALLNIIWLLGYYPELHYYDDVREDAVMPTRSEAEYFAQLSRHYDAEDVDKVLHWLEKNGETKTHRATRYSLILWDIRRRDER
jgi:SAM-dependent methyltransferase